MLRVSLLLVLAGAQASPQIVLPPFDGESEGPMMVFIPNANVPNYNYKATAHSIQEASHRQLWAVIPEYDGKCDQQFVDVALSQAVRQGWKKGPYWLVAHGNAGSCAEDLLDSDLVAGVAFLGALPSEEFDLVMQSKPALIATAELQAGKARPGRAVAWWKQHLEARHVLGPKAWHERPVIVLPDLNNSNFCPGFDLDDDLPAEVDETVATHAIGRAVGAFLDGRSQWEQLESTEQIMTPFLKALDLEHIPTGGVDVNGSSPFCEAAQYVLSGLAPVDQRRLQLTDLFGPTLQYDWAHHENPNGTLMHCHNSNETLPGGKLSVKVCSYAGHNGTNSSSSQRYKFYDGVAAAEMGCKLMSSEFLSHFLNTTATNPNTSCVDVNRMAIKMGTSLATETQLRRWNDRGRKICVVEDTETPGNVGPLWIDGTVNYTETRSCLRVSAFHLKLGLDAGTGILDGVEYCKAMSPAFVLDYIATGSMQDLFSSSSVLV